jgi:hypothetical protein
MARVAVVCSLGVVVSLVILPAAALPVRGDEVGTVAAVAGSAEIGRDGVWAAAAPGTAVAVGDHLRTGRPGRLRVVFRDDSVLTLDEGCTLVVDEQVFDPAAAKSLFGLLEGTIKAAVSEYYGAAGSSYEVKTATAVAGVRGTEFVMSYDPVTRATEVVGVRGVVTVHSAVDPTGPGLLVTASEATAVAAGELPSAPRRLDPETMRRLLRDIEFFGTSQGLSVSEASSVMAGAAVPRAARAPDGAVGQRAALALGPEGPPVGFDASTALGNSPAAIIAGPGSGSVNVNVGRPR